MKKETSLMFSNSDIAGASLQHPRPQIQQRRQRDLARRCWGAFFSLVLKILFYQCCESDRLVPIRVRIRLFNMMPVPVAKLIVDKFSFEMHIRLEDCSKTFQAGWAFLKKCVCSHQRFGQILSTVPVWMAKIMQILCRTDWIWSRIWNRQNYMDLSGKIIRF